jgi:cytochrome c553
MAGIADEDREYRVEVLQQGRKRAKRSRTILACARCHKRKIKVSDSGCCTPKHYSSHLTLCAVV